MSKQLLPNLLIAGVMKGATSSIYTYLSWHPEICASRIKETRYFLPLLQNKNLQTIDTYANYFAHCHKNDYKYLMEATPGYIYGGETLARAVYECLGSIKIVFVLRDPITRLLSYYNLIKENAKMARQIGNISVDEYAVRALNEFIKLKQGGKEECINIYKENVFVGGIAGGLYADYLIHWYSIFGDSIKVYFFEDLKNDPLSFMCELCNWLEIDPKIYSFRNFNIENRKITPRMKYLHDTALSINERLEGFLRSHYKMKTILKAIYCFFNETKRKEERFSESTYKQLESVYTPYNDRLIDILSSKGYPNFPYWLSHLPRNKIERVGIRLVIDKNCKATK